MILGIAVGSAVLARYVVQKPAGHRRLKDAHPEGVVVEPDAGDLSTRRDRSRYRRARVPPSRSDRDTKAPNPRSFGADRFTRASRKMASPVPSVGPLASDKSASQAPKTARGCDSREIAGISSVRHVFMTQCSYRILK